MEKFFDEEKMILKLMRENALLENQLKHLKELSLREGYRDVISNKKQMEGERKMENNMHLQQAMMMKDQMERHHLDNEEQMLNMRRQIPGGMQSMPSQGGMMMQPPVGQVQMQPKPEGKIKRAVKAGAGFVKNAAKQAVVDRAAGAVGGVVNAGINNVGKRLVGASSNTGGYR
jgi:hypothetical protein